MRIASNKLNDVIRFFHAELDELYGTSEVTVFIDMALSHLFNLDKSKRLMNSKHLFSESDLLKINFLIKDLKKQKPIQYIIGKAAFYKLSLNVNAHVLIPRPETEELVDIIIKTHIEKQQLNVLDIGTGSACIAIALSKFMNNANVYAIDLSNEALELANKNAELNKCAIHFLQHDILSNQTPFSTVEWDIIVSNPPYITHSEKKDIQPNVIDFEPHLALFVPDENPFLFYDRIIAFAKTRLKHKGKLFFEINQKHGEYLVQLLTDNGFWDVNLVKDLNNNNRILHGAFYKK
jgi:release factor glutamine methyltransferase